jgi:D-alanyl-D-alanine carboxypeptidase
MLRIRTGAHHGLRWGVFSVASIVAILALSNGQAAAAPYSDIVVDANSGAVLHSTNPDAQRHPASLTKIMTLYLLFEQLEAGKLKLDSQLKVSEAAAGQSPTKLGLRAGTTIQVEDAIKGIITRSANDAAVVVAEAIAGDEASFAALMTRKARALGMASTVYKNASGLPDDDQVTTARDQSTLGRAIQERFPTYYKYFQTRSFAFRGQWIANHNSLLGRVEGVDGIKTGYIRSSGFNLVTSVHRGNRYVVAVVMGGASAGARDARMRELISGKIALASVKRTAPVIAETAVEKPEPKAIARIEPKIEPKANTKVETEAKVTAKVEPKVETKPAGKDQQRFAVASMTSTPAKLDHPVAKTPSEPIRPVAVRTVTVRPGEPPQTAGLAPVNLPTPPAESETAAAPAAVAVAAAPAAVAAPSAPAAPKVATPAVPRPAAAPAAPQVPVAAKVEAIIPPPPGAKPGVLGTMPARTAATEPPSAPATGFAPSPVTAPAKPQVARTGWMIQVGAFGAEQEAKQRLATLQSKAGKVLDGSDPFTESVEKGDKTYYRARFAGFDKDKAEAACKALKRDGVECVTIKN